MQVPAHRWQGQAPALPVCSILGCVGATLCHSAAGTNALGVLQRGSDMRHQAKASEGRSRNSPKVVLWELCKSLFSDARQGN